MAHLGQGGSHWRVVADGSGGSGGKKHESVVFVVVDGSGGQVVFSVCLCDYTSL